MKWKYFKEYVDGPVAELCKDNGETVLRVLESRDSYYTVPES